MEALLLQLLVLATSPVLDRLLRRRGVVESGVDGALQAIVVGIVLFVVLPLGIAGGGLVALGALAAGWLGGALAHRWPGGWRLAGGVAGVALLVHALLDGAALALGDDHAHGGSLLALAVVLHTVPVGLAAWRVARGRGGPRLAVGVLALTAIVTIGGFALGRLALLDAEGGVAAVLQCLLGGALLHVVGEVGAGDVRRAAGVGALLGSGVVAALVALHPIPRVAAEELGAAGAFVGLALACAPWLVLGWGIAAVARALGGRAWRAAAPADVLVSIPLLGPALGLCWAAVAWTADVVGSGRTNAGRRGALAAWREAADASVPAVLVGLGLAALLEPVLTAAALAGWSAPWTLAGAVVVGAWARVPAVGVVPVVAVLLHKGLPPGAGVALVLASALGGPGGVAVSVSALAALAVGGLVALTGLGGAVPALHAVAEGAPGVARAGAAVIVVLAAVESLLRLGPVGFLAPVIGGPTGLHVHGPDCGHAPTEGGPEDLPFAVLGSFEPVDERGWGVRRR